MTEKFEFKVVPLRHVETGALEGYTLLARPAGRGSYKIPVVDLQQGIDGKTFYQVKTRGEAHQKRRELSGSPLIEVGQVWCDADPRMTRWIRIIRLDPSYVVYSTCAADGTGFGRQLHGNYDAFQLDGQDVARGFVLSNRSR